METLSWSRVESRLESSDPWILSMGGTRGAKLGFDPKAHRFYLRMPADGETAYPYSPYSELEVSLRRDAGGLVFEVATDSRPHFPEFHRLATLVVEEFENPASTCSGAFLTAVEGWRQLVSVRQTLTSEEQSGLYGELLVLKALLRGLGHDAVDCWIARDAVHPGRHDFRLATVDLEVKTTRSLKRVHFVHGLRQLDPALDHDLYVVSIRLETSGGLGGKSLADQVAMVRDLIGMDTRARRFFEAKLQLTGFRDEDATFYGERLTLSDQARLVPVDDECPKLTEKLLRAAMSGSQFARIGQIDYQVDLDGLGFPESSSEFVGVLGQAGLEIE